MVWEAFTAQVKADAGLMEDLGTVGVPGGGGAVGVQDQGPAAPVDHDLMAERAQQDTADQAGGAAVGFVLDVMHLAGCGGLVAAARALAATNPERAWSLTVRVRARGGPTTLTWQ